MSSLDQDSLFSLEIVADQLTLSNKICCRFPAVAFRLLDFPTLVVYHVEPDLGVSIKRQIRLDSRIDVPHQLADLQTRNGVYDVKKGKSCLFKVPPNVLRAHLQNTPLYVMVIDTYPDTPKLVGNCTVPLDMPMNAIYNAIVKEGISKPITHGEKGSYKLYNLMGAEIGQVTFGFRIISLGVGLISHIPDKSIAKVKKPFSKKTAATSNQVMPKPIEEEATELILEDLRTADESIQVVLSAPQPDTSVCETQTGMYFQKVAMTQTDEQRQEAQRAYGASRDMENIKKKKLRKQEKKANSIDTLSTMAQLTPPTNDIIITNTVCPPALFYNSKADPPLIAPGLTLDDYLVYRQKDAMKADSETESIDSDDTIRPEDRFSDSELETKKVRVKTECEYVTDYPLQPKKKSQPKKPAEKPVVSLGALAHYPLLSALMSEISSLQGVQVNQSATKGVTEQQGTIRESRSATQIRSSPSKKTLRPVSPTRTYMLRKAMSAMVAAKQYDEVSSQTPSSQHTTPEHVPHTPKKQKEAAKKAPGQSKPQKQRPVSAPQQKNRGVPSELVPGMTKSQRLRLQKTNPQLLEKLDKEEKERVEKFKAKRMAMGAGFYNIEVNQSAEGNQYDQFKRRGPDLHLHGHRKPVPTPRASVDTITVREVPSPEPRKSKRRVKVDKEEFEEDEYETAESEPDMIQIPSARMDDTDSEFGYDEVPVKDPAQAFGKTYSSGLTTQPDKRSPKTPPKSSPKSQTPPWSAKSHTPPWSSPKSQTPPKASPKSNDPFKNTSPRGFGSQSIEPAVQYSTDFDNGDTRTEAIDAGEELGLQRMVDAYPTDEEEEESDGNESQGDAKNSPGSGALVGRDPGEELGLRQVISEYSDSSEDDSKKSQKSNTSPEFYSAKSESDEDTKPKPKLKLTTSVVRTVAPATSNMSPSIASKPDFSSRNPMTESLSTVTESNPDSTAFINRSEMASSNFSSMESTGGMDFRSARRGNRNRPLASPRKSLERIHTESVSSYAPSDPDMVPLSPTAEYSDEFDTVDEDSHGAVNLKYMKDAKVAPESRFGYTWSGTGN